MTVDSRRCFSTIEELKRFEPETLRRFLAGDPGGKPWPGYPAYVAARLGSLPDPPTAKTMTYELIVPMFMEEGEDTPGDFLEKMILIIDMGKPAGNSKLQEEARRCGVAYDSIRGKTLCDTAMRAAMLPGDLLDRAHARMMLFRKRRYAYYPPFLDEVPEYRKPTQEALDALSANLTRWFHGAEPKIRAKVLFWDFPNEAWFLVRRGGQPIRMAVYDEDTGDTVSRFLRPEAYDGIVYNKRYGELRMISRLLAPVREGYLSRFGDLLTGNPQFFGHRKMFFPERVAEMHREDLAWAGNMTIGEIRLAEVQYQTPGGGTCKRKHKKCLLPRAGESSVIPARCEAVEYVQFKFRFLSDRRERPVRVEAGNEATYQRDSDAALLEEFLRAKCLMRTLPAEKLQDEKAA